MSARVRVERWLRLDAPPVWAVVYTPDPGRISMTVCTHAVWADAMSFAVRFARATVR